MPRIAGYPKWPGGLLLAAVEVVHLCARARPGLETDKRWVGRDSFFFGGDNEVMAEQLRFLSALDGRDKENIDPRTGLSTAQPWQHHKQRQPSRCPRQPLRDLTRHHSNHLAAPADTNDLPPLNNNNNKKRTPYDVVQKRARQHAEGVVVAPVAPAGARHQRARDKRTTPSVSSKFYR